MKCPNCGKEIGVEDKICKTCDFDLEKYRNTVESGISKVSEEDVTKALEKSDIAITKAGTLSKRGGIFLKLFMRIELLVMLLKDWGGKKYKEVPWTTIAAVAFAILYFVNPFDLIPDFIPGVGYLDDIAVLALVFMSIEYELKKYAQWKGLNLEDYF